MRRKSLLKGLPLQLATRLFCFAVFIALSSYFAPVFAQQTVTSATLGGRVEDASGASVRGASLTITNLDTNQTQTTTSDSEGRFRFSNVAVGSSSLTVEREGFAAFSRQLM